MILALNSGIPILLGGIVLWLAFEVRSSTSSGEKIKNFLMFFCVNWYNETFVPIVGIDSAILEKRKK